MLVLKTTSPKVSPSAPKLRPENTVPSSRASLATISGIDSPRSRGHTRREILLTIASDAAEGHARTSSIMSIVKLALEQIVFVRNYTTHLLDNVPPEDWFRQPSGGVSTIAWQVGH